MGDSEAYTGGAMFLGLLLIFGSYWYATGTGGYDNWLSRIGFGIGVLLFVVGYFALRAGWQQWYCSACGQKVGQGKKPDRCQRCGSNRLTTSDPGAGQKVRVENEGGNGQPRDQRQTRDRRQPRDRRR